MSLRAGMSSTAVASTVDVLLAGALSVSFSETVAVLASEPVALTEPWMLMLTVAPLDIVPTPQVSVEFEVADESAITEGAQELRARGFELLHDAKTEPWGQVVARLLSPDGAVVGLSYAPSLHE